MVFWEGDGASKGTGGTDKEAPLRSVWLNAESSAVSPCNAAGPVISVHAHLVCLELVNGVEHSNVVAGVTTDKAECLHLPFGGVGAKTSGEGERWLSGRAGEQAFGEGDQDQRVVDC